MPLLELKNITKDFSGIKALSGVSFTLGPGEIHALCGENGAGKSTLIKILCGYYPFGSYQGEILLQNQPVHFKSLKDSEEKGIALIAQELALVPELSIAENIWLGREPLRHGLIQWDQVHEDSLTALERVGLSIDPRKPMKELGIGQQQLVEIAKALSKEIKILVLDEPTAALTETDSEKLLELLRQLRSRGISSIYISHRLEEVQKIADRVTVLRDGKSITTGMAGELTREKIIAHMVGREVENLYPRAPAAAGKTLLSVQNFKVEDADNPGQWVVNDVSFDVRAGEVLGIAGLMGSGRTALVSSLFGAARSGVSGTLVAAGAVQKLFKTPEAAIASGVALVSEDRKKYGLVLESPVQDNLILAFIKKMVKNFTLDRAKIESECGKQVRNLKIKIPGLASPVHQLSGGNQQKIVLGKWLMTEPKILFLDEPTRGIDVGAKSEIYELIGHLVAQGMGIVMVSSDLPELLGLSHRILVMNQGSITARFTAEEATPEKVLAAAALKAG